MTIDDGARSLFFDYSHRGSLFLRLPAIFLLEASSPSETSAGCCRLTGACPVSVPFVGRWALTALAALRAFSRCQPHTLVRQAIPC